THSAPVGHDKHAPLGRSRDYGNRGQDDGVGEGLEGDIDAHEGSRPEQPVGVGDDRTVSPEITKHFGIATFNGCAESCPRVGKCVARSV
ncbi:MAG: hypothetical protein EBT83_01515, partial [Betaproteobacteria bacterium]|nr:hypothetical protein [Betaproteobacteria bacterium]